MAGQLASDDRDPGFFAMFRVFLGFAEDPQRPEDAPIEPASTFWWRRATVAFVVVMFAAMVIQVATA